VSGLCRSDRAPGFATGELAFRGFASGGALTGNQMVAQTFVGWPDTRSGDQRIRLPVAAHSPRPRMPLAEAPLDSGGGEEEAGCGYFRC
jgi:hypothetical protein